MVVHLFCIILLLLADLVIKHFFVCSALGPVGCLCFCSVILIY